MMSGWDVAFVTPGLSKERDCVVCSSKMDVFRNLEGPTSSIQAMFGGKSKHDKFICPNVNEGWHKQALELLLEAQDTNSKFLKSFLDKEVKKILKTKKPTLKKFNDENFI